MRPFEQAALDKLAAEKKNYKATGQHAGAVKDAVYDALVGFVKQSGEFAQAVAQKDGTFSDCVAEVVKNCGSCLSDIEAYRRAVRYYFSGAEIHFNMTIDLIGVAAAKDAEAAAPKPAGLMLNLDDFI